MSLVKVETLLKYLGDSSGVKGEAGVQAAIDRAESLIAAHLQRDKLSQDTFADEMYDGTGRSVLQLHRVPVTAISSVKEANVAMTIGTDPNASPAPEVIWYGDLGHLVRPFGVFLPFRRHYKVSFTAGYSTATLPATIIQGILDGAALLLREKDRIGIQSKSTANQVVQFVRELPKFVRDGLDAYKLAAPGRFYL